MKTLILIFVLTAAIGSAAEHEALALERAAAEGWLKGDARPALAAADESITYFHIVSEKRIEGRAAVRDLFAAYQGQPLYDRYEILEPKVQAEGDTAVVTFLFVTYNGDVVRRWKATQVYRQRKEGWRAIHAHWSSANAPQR